MRFHGLLSDDLGPVVRQHRGGLVFSFFNADRIIDFLLSIEMRPFVELSFMPTALASGSKTVFHYRGNVTPPRDYRQWSALIRTLLAHWVDRYGLREVAKWPFEVWNEPNLKAFWQGSRKDYFNLYQVTANAIKKVDPLLRVGGPATARDGWIDERRWQALGAREYLDDRQVEQLHDASRLTPQTCPWTWRDGQLDLEIELPPHAVAAVVVKPVPA